MNSASDSQICALFDISDEDILEAMKDMPGYLDITPGDFKDLYEFAHHRAMERLTRMIKARDVMTQNVITVQRDTPSGEVALLMAENGIAGVPVLDGKEKVIGIISEKDFLVRMGGRHSGSFMDVVAQCLRNKGCVAITMRQQKAEDLMTSPPVTVGPSTPVSQIAAIFKDRSINRVPVIDETGRLVGIVARADILQAAFPRGGDTAK
jgi:CBS domain-containing protein